MLTKGFFPAQGKHLTLANTTAGGLQVKAPPLITPTSLIPEFTAKLAAWGGQIDYAKAASR